MPPHEKMLIGLIEDDEIMGESLVQGLELEGYAVSWWRTGEEAFERLSAEQPDLIMCDIMLPGMSGEEVFTKFLTGLGGRPFLFITARSDIKDAVRLTKAGAADYIAKPFELPDLLARIGQLIARRPKETGVLGVSAAMRSVEMVLRRVANIDSTLLLTGESGVGKEVAANFVHNISIRAGQPFIPVNCAAIPNDLIESVLFGHEKGAFTSAQSRHRGHVEQARGGILFLDEVAELPLMVQAKLLRLIQERKFTRVGGEGTITTDARIICATNIDLQRAVAEVRFRGDLYYRINVISVVIPALRNRREDILPLAQQFLREFAAAFKRGIDGSTPVNGLTAAAEEALLEYPWPGNVRELRNCVERAVALSDAPWIGSEMLFFSSFEEPVDTGARYRTLAEVRKRAEADHIRAALGAAGKRVDEAAKLLGVSRSTLFEKMKKLEIRSDL